MFKKSLLILLMILLIGQGKSKSEENDSKLILSDLIAESLENNPDLLAAYNTWQASETRIPQAGSLPDPVFSFSIANVPIDNFVFDQEPMTGKKFSLMQMFPFPGKLGLKEKIAGESSKVSQLQYEELKNQLIKEVTKVYYDIFFIDKSIETNQKNAVLIKQFTQIAETRYKVGKGLQQDVLKAHVEYSKLTDQLIILQQKREVLEAKLNMLLNREMKTQIGKPVEPTFQTENIDFIELTTLAEKNRPLLLSWQTLIGQSEQKVKLAKKGYLPDFILGLSYTQRDVLSSGLGGVDYLSGQISVSIPLYFKSKQKKNIQEEQLTRQAIEQKYKNISNLVEKEIETSLTSLQKNKKRAELFKGNIIPQASQTLNSSLSAYQVDKVEFLTLVSNQLALFNFELEYFKAVSDYQKDFAELEFLVGKKLNRETRE